MSKSVKDLSDITIIKPSTRFAGACAAASPRQVWLKGFPVCPELQAHQISHVGLADGVFKVVRQRQSSTYFLACLGGEGQVLVDGQWRRCAAGDAFLLPPHIRNAFYTMPGKRWQFAWVCYMQPLNQTPVLAASSPVAARFNAQPLRHAILGLQQECLGENAPARIHHWVELIQTYVMHFARPWQTSDRLSAVWEQVAANLAADWTLQDLARLAGCSPETLRRLCRQHLGRSPKHHLIHLRMRRAADLLVNTEGKVEHIARLVGYQNPFVFSTSFKKSYGWSPSKFSLRQRSE